MLEDLRSTRRFYSLTIILLLTGAFIVVHLGFIVDIPYVPTTLCFRIPAIFSLTMIYLFLMFTLRSIKVHGELKHKEF